MREYYQYSPKEMVSPSLAVFDCGKESCKPEHRMGPAIRAYYLIHYIVGGKGTYTVGGKTHHLATGDIFLIRPGEVTTYGANSSDPWRYYWVGFQGFDAESLAAAAGFENGYVVHHKRDRLLEKYFSDMCFQSSSARARDCAVLGYLYLVFSCLIERSVDRERADRGKQIAEAASKYIHSHYTEDINIAAIAQALRVDRSHLYRVFKQHMKTSPMDYLMHMRLLNACIALQETDKCVYEIAYDVGFRDLSHFSKMFRKKYHISPSEYRKQPRTPAILLTDDQK